MKKTLAGMPKIYSDTVARQLEEHGDKLTLESLREALELRYRVENNFSRDDSEDDDDEEGELTLTGLTNIECFNCGRKGHKAAKCPYKKKDVMRQGKINTNNKMRNKRFNGTCNNCGR